MTRVSNAMLLAASRVGGEVVPARAQMATTLGFVPAAVLTPFQIFVGDTAALSLIHI